MSLMTTAEAAQSALGDAKSAALNAQRIYLESSANNWRTMANDKVEKLVLEKQPSGTQSLGERVGKFKTKIQQVILSGSEFIAELFSNQSDPKPLTNRPGADYYTNIRIKFNSFKWP